jgi:hypothetical protein
MNAPNNPFGPDDYTGELDSRGSQIVIIDGPGDTTVRPSRPLLRRLAEAELARIRRCESLAQGTPPEPSDPGAEHF